MYEEIRDRAITNLEKKRKKVRAMQIVGVIMGSVALFLFFVIQYRAIKVRVIVKARVYL